MARHVKVSVTVIVVVALLAARSGLAANPAAESPASLSHGKSFRDHASTNDAEELSYSVPASFHGPLTPQPRRKPEPRAMLLACLGLIVYLGRRRNKALAIAAA